MTISPLPKEPLPIRLVFKLERAEHPRLYDELIRFRKGAKRVNRLRLLAYDGLLVQQGLLKLPGQTLSGTPGSIGFAARERTALPTACCTICCESSLARSKWSPA